METAMETISTLTTLMAGDVFTTGDAVTTGDVFTTAFSETFANSTVFEGPPQNRSSVLLFKDYPAAALRTGFVFLIIFAVFGVFANAISMLALTRSSKLQNATTALLVNLCFSDLLFSGTNTPFAVTVFWYGDWVYPHHICVAYGVSRFFNVGASVFTVIAIAINRLVIITKPTGYKQIFTPGNNLLVITSTWMITFILLIWPTAAVWGRFAWDAEIGTCSVVPYKGRSSKAFLFMVAYFLPTVFFIICYSRIYWVVRKAHRNLRQYSGGKRTSAAFIANLKRRIGEPDLSDQHVQKQTRRTEKEMRLLRMILVIFVTFTTCYLPLLVLKAFRLLDNYPGVQVVAYLTFYLSGCVNPVIYICMSKEYRKAYWELLSRKQGSQLSDSGGSRETGV